MLLKLTSTCYALLDPRTLTGRVTYLFPPAKPELDLELLQPPGPQRAHPTAGLSQHLVLASKVPPVTLHLLFCLPSMILGSFKIKKGTFFGGSVAKNLQS